MAIPIRRSLQASAVAALVLSGVLLVHVLAVIVFIDGFSSSKNLIGQVVRQLPAVGVFFVIAFSCWLLGVAPEVPPPPSRVRGAFVAGVGIPVVVAIVFVILDATGIMEFSGHSVTRDDGLKRVSPGVLFMVASAVVGCWLTGRRSGGESGLLGRRATT